MSAAEAREGVEDGTYYLSLTVPEDFSKRIASSSGDYPETGALKVRTNDANNYIVGQISRTRVLRGARGGVDQVRPGPSSTRSSSPSPTSTGRPQKAAKGADELERRDRQGQEGPQGPRERPDGREGGQRHGLQDGVAKLNKGAGELETGSRTGRRRHPARWPTRSTACGRQGRSVPEGQRQGDRRHGARLVADAAPGASRNDLDNLRRHGRHRGRGRPPGHPTSWPTATGAAARAGRRPPRRLPRR